MGLNHYKEFLLAHDPDALVDVLGVSSEELIEAFPEKVEQLFEKEGDDDDEVFGSGD